MASPPVWRCPQREREFAPQRMRSVRSDVSRAGRRLLRPWCIIVLLALHACASAAPRPARGPVRVMTYNIFAGNDLERRSNLTRIAALIDSLAVDIVFLQEVDRRTVRSGNTDQAAVLGELTGMHVVFGRSFDFNGGEYGNAILTRWPVQHVQVVPLEVPLPAELAERNNEPRSLLHVVTRTPAGELHLMATHLDHRAESLLRQAQLLRLLAFVAETVPRTAPFLLGGDFNARPDTPEVRALTLSFSDAWRTCGTGDGFTFRSDQPDRRIDYVWLARAGCSRAWVPDIQLSDHRPVIVDVHFEGSHDRRASLSGR